MCKLLYGLFLTALLTGCASVAPLTSSSFSSHGQAGPQAHTQTSVSLAEENFIVVKTNVVGISKGFSLLGIIPMSPARMTTAMDRLYAEAGIQAGSSKTLAHLVVEHTSTYWILFSIPETIVRADVVQFKPKTEPGSSTNNTSSG